jgi:hypothetical protein
MHANNKQRNRKRKKKKTRKRPKLGVKVPDATEGNPTTSRSQQRSKGHLPRKFLWPAALTG